MTLEEWKSKGRYYQYGDHEIFTIEEGHGDALLLIHGFPTASWDWWQMWKELASRYHVITLDMLGFGFSDKPKKHTYSIHEQADIIEALLKSRDIDQVKVLSHDYGDTVAQELLARHNQRQKENESGLAITSLCFLNGGLFPETHQALPIQKVLLGPFGWIVSRLFNRKKLGANFKRIFGPHTQPTEYELDEFWSLICYNDGHRLSHRLIKYMQDRIDHRDRWVEAIQQADIPIRLIDGVVDPISGQHMADRYKEIIPNPDVIELADIGHFPLIEAPELVLKYYLEFLGVD